jgi:hypothetical protein
MRAVGPLLAPHLDQAARLETLEHPVQQEVLGLAGNKAGAEFGEHVEVEPRIGKLKPERVLPIDPRAHGIGRLSIAEMLKKLEDCDQGQSPRGQGRLTSGRIERAEVLVLVQGAELLAQPRDEGALGKGGPGNPSAGISPIGSG